MVRKEPKQALWNEPTQNRIILIPEEEQA